MNPPAPDPLLACPCCAAADVEGFDVDLPLFPRPALLTRAPGCRSSEHQESAALVRDEPYRLGLCSRCGALFREANAGLVARMDRGYRCASGDTPGHIHTVVVPDGGRAFEANRLQAERLVPLLPRHGARVLDFGCFQGALLASLGRLVEADLLCGFDVAARHDFPEGAPFRFVLGDTAALEGSFHLIVLSQSLQFIRDIPSLMTLIRRVLAPEGSVYVRVPDVARKPVNLLLADAHYHFTPAILRRMLASHGIAADTIADSPFPADVSVVGGLPGAVGVPDCDSRALLRHALERVTAMQAAFAALGPEPVAVFGTTLDAVFAGHCLGGRVACYVDENPFRVGATLAGRPVLHPSEVPPGLGVIVPMDTVDHAPLIHRLVRHYGNRILTVASV